MKIDPYIDDRLRSNKPTNFLGFIDDLRKLWDEAGKIGTLTRNHQKDDASADEYPVITYRIKHRRPHPKWHELKPRIRDTIRHPYQPGEYIELYGQVYQVIVEFTILSSSDEEADEITGELEEFLLMYKGFFKRQGVKEIFFLEQGEDETDSTAHFPLAKRTLLFDMQFEKVIPKFVNQIEQLALQANIHNNLQNNEEES